VNLILSAGSAFSLGIGVLYLWVFTPDQYAFWPHYLLLSFYIFLVLFGVAVMASILDPVPVVLDRELHTTKDLPKPTKRVWTAWILLIFVMIGLYLIFNWH
jgi:SSS family solute:Na+ symporter